jgi:tetratricopeptide (TPR) repeat protein
MKPPIAAILLSKFSNPVFCHFTGYYSVHPDYLSGHSENSLNDDSMILTRKLRWIAFCSLFFFVSTFAYSQSEKEIIVKYKSTIQKIADEHAIQSMELRGVFTMQNLNFPGAIYYKAPNFRIEMTFQSLTFLQVNTDSLKWEYNPFEDKNTITPADKKESGSNGWSKQNNSFDFVNYDLMNYQELKHSVKLIAQKKMDSLNVYVLELTKSDKTKIQFFINAKNSLIYKVEDQNGYRYFADYTNIEGFVFPRFVIDSSPKQVLQVRFNQLAFNKALSDTLFIIPKHALESANQVKENQDQTMVMADSLANLGRYEEAIEYYSKAISANGRNYAAFNARGLAKLNQKEYYDAITDFNRALEIDPSKTSAINNRGLAKYYLGDNAGAIKDYTKTLELEPTHLVALRNRGTAYLHEAKNEEARKDFAEALKLSPDDSESHYKLGVVLAQLEKYEDALTSYSLAIKNLYKDADIYNYKGVSYYKLEKYDSAGVNFKKAVTLDSDNLQYLENYARALYELGDYKSASKQFENYLNKKNDESEIYNLLGLCKYREENYKGAIKDFSKAIELNVKQATYFDNRASSREMLEDYEGAIQDYTESIRIYPNDASVFYKRGLIKIQTSKKIEGCLDLATANEMEYEPAKEAILKNCN